MAKVVGYDSKEVHRCTCRNCSAIIEYTKNEVHHVSGRDYGGGPDGKEFIHCPNCGKEVVVRAW